MAAENAKPDHIALHAERDMNTYQSKTGEARPQALDEGAATSTVQQKFPGAKVASGEDLTEQAYGTPVQRRDAAREQEQQEQQEQERQQAQSSIAIGLGSARDMAGQGAQATRSNVGPGRAGVVGGAKFKAEDYFAPELVPDSIAAEGWVPPESVTQASRETEGYERK